MSSSRRMMATRQPMRMAVGLPSALATGCWPLGSSSGRGEHKGQDHPCCGGPREDWWHRTHMPLRGPSSPKLLKLVGGGPGGHQGAGGKVPPKVREESFTTSGEKGEKRGSQIRGQPKGGRHA